MTTKLLFDMCDWTVDSDIGTGDFPLVPGIFQVCGHTDVRTHVPPGMDCFSSKRMSSKRAA